MQFDAALAAQETFGRAEAELGSDWDTAVELEDTFSSNAGSTAREAYEGLLALAARHPNAHSFQAFCIFITWQQVTEETIAHHFQTGLRLCETFLASADGKHRADVSRSPNSMGHFVMDWGLMKRMRFKSNFEATRLRVETECVSRRSAVRISLHRISV